LLKSDESPLVDHFVCDLEGDFGIAGADEGEQAVTVLADEGFLVIATNIVPFDSVVVEVVQDGQARLSLVFTVVGLRASIKSSVGPVTQFTLVGWRDLGLGTGPEPSVDDGWLKISARASVKVALAATGPDELDAIASKLLLNELVLLQSLQADGVHAMATANVTGV